VARTPTFYILKYDAFPEELIVSEDLSWIDRNTPWATDKFEVSQSMVVLSGKGIFRFSDKDGYGYKNLEGAILFPGDGLYGSRDNFPESNGSFNFKFKAGGVDTYHKVKGVDSDHGLDLNGHLIFAATEDNTQMACINNNEKAPHECLDSMYIPAGGSKTLDVEVGQLLCVMKGACSFNGVAKKAKDWIGVDENKPVVIESIDSCVIGAFKNSTPYANWYV
jgi:hypothetical protein